MRGWTIALIFAVSCAREPPRAATPVDGGVAAAAAPSPPPAPVVENAEPEEDLRGEEPERDPHAATVTIKLVADPKRQAHVSWGSKDLGVAPLDITRPRGSGPLDLVVTAPGTLPLHIRAFTDRDEKIALRLYSVGEAPALLGYERQK